MSTIPIIEHFCYYKSRWWSSSCSRPNKPQQTPPNSILQNDKPYDASSSPRFRFMDRITRLKRRISTCSNEAKSAQVSSTNMPQETLLLQESSFRLSHSPHDLFLPDETSNCSHAQERRKCHSLFGRPILLGTNTIQNSKLCKNIHRNPRISRFHSELAEICSKPSTRPEVVGDMFEFNKRIYHSAKLRRIKNPRDSCKSHSTETLFPSSIRVVSGKDNICSTNISACSTVGTSSSEAITNFKSRIVYISLTYSENDFQCSETLTE